MNFFQFSTTGSAENVLLYEKITHAKSQLSILKIHRSAYYFKKLIMLRKCPQKNFPHHFFHVDPKLFERVDAKIIREK